MTVFAKRFSLLLTLIALPLQFSVAQSDLLVSGRFDNRVVRFSSATGAFVGVTAQTGLSNPVGVALGPDGNLYVANDVTNQILRYNFQTGALIGVFASGGGLSGPRDICFGPDSNLYVASGGTSQVLRYNGLTGAFMGVFASGGALSGPVAVRFGPDGNLYVSGGSSNAIYCYNGSTGSFIKVFATGGGLSNPAYIDFGFNRDLFVSNFNSNQVLRFNGVTGALKGVFGSVGLTQPIPIKFGPDGNLCVGSADQDKVYKYDGLTGASLGTTAAGSGLDNPNGIAYAPSPSSTAATFGFLGDLTGGLVESHAAAVSADGLTVVGLSDSASGPQAFRWQAGSMTGLGDLSGGAFRSTARGVNFDGTVVVGDADSASGREAFRWTLAGGMVGLSDLAGGIFSSSASSASGDGTSIFGVGTDSTGNVAFRWTQAGGIVSLGDLTGGSVSSEAWRTNSDGSVAVGRGTSANGTEAFRWTSAGMVALGDVSGGIFSSTAYGISANGNFVVGEVSSAAGTEAGMWSNGGVATSLGDLAGGAQLSRSRAVSDNGRIVVGQGTTASGSEAFIWISGHGIMSLKSFLTAQGATGLSGITPTIATDISPDGSTIVGDASDSVGTTLGFIAKIRPVPIAILFSPSPAYRGSSTNEGTVYLSSPAAPGGMFVDLSSSNNNVASTPTTVLVPEGMTRVRFRITAPNTSLSPMTVTLTATANGFSKAASLSVITPQDLLVSSDLTNSVKRYNGASGAYLGDFVPAGSGGLTRPQGLTFGPDGNLYVSSGSTGRVLKYNASSGAFMSAFTQGPLLAFPADMDWRGGTLYVSDFGGTSVHTYNSTTGAYLGVFNSTPVASPDGLSWDGSGNLYVSSFSGFIREFNSLGTFVRDFVPSGGVAQPLDSRFGSDGNFYVNSFSTGIVKKFNGTTGALISNFISGLGQTQGQAIGPDGKLYVGSYNGNYIKRYDPVTGADLGMFANTGGLVGPNNFAFAPLPPLFAALTANPNPLPGGASCTGTVSLNIVAPSGGQVVTLSSDNPNVTVPASVTIGAGSSSATFSIAATNGGYGKFTATISATTSSVTKTLLLTVAPSNSASFSTQSVATSMIAGQTYPATIQFNNTGARTWDTAHGYALQSKTPDNNTTFGMSRIALSNSPVTTGQLGTFATNVIAPSTAGSYVFQWRPIQDDIGIGFGPNTTPVTITVTKAADAARFISKLGPTTVNAGADFTATFTMMNVGTNTWTTAAYSLRPIYNNWNVASIPLPSDTAPNAQKAFSRILMAPITPGSYNYQWQMFKTAFFGDKTPFMTIVVTLGADDAQFISETAISNSVAPSATFGATFTMKNLGTATWGAGYNLVAIGSNNFGIASIASGAVTQNNSGPFTATFTAPATPGTYTFQMRMSNSGTKFGQAATLHTIVVSADAAQFISRTGPSTINAGTDFFVQNTMKNTGSTSWTGAAGYYLMSQTPANNTTWTINKMFLPGAGPFAPGTSVLFTGKCTAPITPGTYFMQWQMSKSGVAFGEKTPYLTITVTAGPDNAQFVSQTGVPTTIAQGATFNATITMKNTGSATWDGNYSLASVGSNNFGVASIVATTTAPNGNKAFTATFTVLGTPGATYTFQMRMQHASTKFGQPSPSMTITVAPPHNVYVSSFNSGAVIEYDGATGAFVRTVTSGVNGPYGICFGSDDILYLGTLNTPKKIWRYNVADGTILGQFADMGGADRSDIRFGSDGSLYAVREGSAGGVMKFIASTGQNLGNFTPAIVDPIAMAFGPNGDLFVDSASQNLVLRFNGSTGALIGTFASTGMSQPYGMCFGPDGNLYVANVGTDSITRYNGTTGALMGTFATGGGLNDPTGILFGPDGNLLVSSALTNQILRFNGSTGAFMNVFASGGGLNGPTFLTLGPGS